MPLHKTLFSATDLNIQSFNCGSVHCCLLTPWGKYNQFSKHLFKCMCKIHFSICNINITSWCPQLMNLTGQIVCKEKRSIGATFKTVTQRDIGVFRKPLLSLQGLCFSLMPVTFPCKITVSYPHIVLCCFLSLLLAWTFIVISGPISASTLSQLSLSGLRNQMLAQLTFLNEAAALKDELTELQVSLPGFVAHCWSNQSHPEEHYHVE